MVRTRKHWSPAEDGILAKWAGENVPDFELNLGEIAKTLNRSPGGVATRLQSLGYEVSKEVWREVRLRAVLEMDDPRETTKAISREEVERITAQVFGLPRSIADPGTIDAEEASKRMREHDRLFAARVLKTARESTCRAGVDASLTKLARSASRGGLPETFVKAKPTPAKPVDPFAHLSPFARWLQNLLFRPL